MAASSSQNTILSYSPSQVPIFEGEHYNYWSNQVHTLFISLELWEIVEDGFEEISIEDSTKK